MKSNRRAWSTMAAGFIVTAVAPVTVGGQRSPRSFAGFGRYDDQNRRSIGAGPGQPGRLCDQWGQSGVCDAAAQGWQRGFAVVTPRRGLPRPVRRRCRTVERPLPGGVRLAFSALRRPGATRSIAVTGFGRVRASDRRGGRAVPASCSTPCGTSPRSVTAATSRPRSWTAASEPHRPPRVRLRRSAVRQQRQPARQADQDRRTGQRGGGLVQRGRRLREVRLHGQLRRRADADGGPRLPRPVPHALPEANFGLSWLQQAVEPGAEGALYPGRASATATPATPSRATTTSGSCRSGGPAERRPRRYPGPSAYYVKYRPVFAAAAPGRQGQPRPGRALRRRLRPRRPAGRDGDSAQAEHLLSWPAASTRWRRRPTSASSSPRSRTTSTRVPSGRATCCGAPRRSPWPTRRRGAGRAGAGRPVGRGALGAGVPRAGPPAGGTPSTSTTPARSARPN